MARHSSASSSRSRSRSRTRTRSSRTRSRTPRRRSRDRSRSGRSRNRSRSRSSDSRIERSTSRTLYQENDTPAGIVPKLIKEQQDFLVELIADHKQEVDAKLLNKQRRFGSKALEKQHDIAAGYKELVEKALKAVKSNNRKKAKSTLKELKKNITEHQEDLVIADISPNGWLAVSKLRNRTELPNSIRKKLEKVDKEIFFSKKYGGGAKKKFSKIQGSSDRSDVRTSRAPQKLSPEELLYNASRQIRAGVCSHCKKANHFYRECPDFWKKVQESREERSRGQQSPN